MGGRGCPGFEVPIFLHASPAHLLLNLMCAQGARYGWMWGSCTRKPLQAVALVSLCKREGGPGDWVDPVLQRVARVEASHLCCQLAPLVQRFLRLGRGSRARTGPGSRRSSDLPSARGAVKLQESKRRAVNAPGFRGAILHCRHQWQPPLRRFWRPHMARWRACAAQALGR